MLKDYWFLKKGCSLELLISELLLKKYRIMMTCVPMFVYSCLALERLDIFYRRYVFRFQPNFIFSGVFSFVDSNL
jgi:hypothetical protein